MVTAGHLETLRRKGFAISVEAQLIENSAEAELVAFRGSPTLYVAGVDPFADTTAPVGLACRIYRTPTGPAGSPTLEQLRRVLTGV